MLEFKLPDLGEGIHEGEILAWHVVVGETVEPDAPLVDIETDKAAVTIPAPRGGRIAARNGEVGDLVKVGEVLVVIADSNLAADAAARAAPEAPARASAGNHPVQAPAQVKRLRRPVPAAPATRRLARELGVDINLAQATGPGGRVLVADVQHFATGTRSAGAQQAAAPAIASIPGPAPARALVPGKTQIPFVEVEPLPDFSQWGPIEREPLRSVRRRVARKMATSMVLVPHVAHMDEADVTDLEALRRRENARRSGTGAAHLTLLPFVVKAVTAGLRAARAFNASLDPFAEEIIYKRYTNIGVAVDSGHGLIVPVVRDTDRKSIVQIASEIEALARQARDGEIAIADLRGGTFTITNIGAIGGTGMVPTINYPEVAILGMGRVQDQVVARGGEIAIRKMLPLTLGFDHRVADGAEAARFVNGLVRQLSDPNLLLLES